MANRLSILKSAYQKSANLFTQLEGEAITFTGNLNSTRGKCTTENLPKLLGAINQAVGRVTSLAKPVIAEYGNKANLY